MMYIHDATEEAYKNGYEKGKADGAREVFEEIENLFLKDNFRLICNRSAFAELKQKYTAQKSGLSQNVGQTKTLIEQGEKEVIMANRTSKNVKCPFYHKHDGGKIKCEGLTDSNTIHLVFETPVQRAKWMREHCNSIQACQTCLIHKTLYEKWEM